VRAVLRADQDERDAHRRVLGIGGSVVAVVRDEELMRFDDPRAKTVKPGDRVVYLRSHRG
jgi:hypothetical protein